MSKKYLYKKRTFLNDDVELSAFLIALVPQGVNGNRCYPTFDLSDCSDKISLDFGFYSRKEMAKVKKKLRLFKSIVNDFADAMEKEFERIEALPLKNKEEDDNDDD